MEKEVISCPNCGAKMSYDEPCSECPHVDGDIYDCECDNCESQRAEWDKTRKE